jgi:lysophospholipase L1-like esterase
VTVRRQCAALAIGTALALLTSCGGSGKPTSATPPTPIRWIAAGDSYSAGQGAPGAQAPCDLTEQAMAPRARDLISGDIVIDAFVHVACSDAVIDQVLAQVRAGSAKSPAEQFNLVTMTIGGNDLGFAQVVADCVGEDDLRDRVTRGKQAGCDVTEEELMTRVDALPSRLVPLYKAVLDELAPRGALVVVGYPNLFSDPAGWKDATCNLVSKSDAMMLRRVATALDARIAGAAKQVGATYVSVADEFKGHELCGPLERWMNGIALKGSFHPTGKGYQAEGELLAKALRALYGR